jgi:hypothetical protein
LTFWHLTRNAQEERRIERCHGVRWLLLLWGTLEVISGGVLGPRNAPSESPVPPCVTSLGSRLAASPGREGERQRESGAGVRHLEALGVRFGPDEAGVHQLDFI